MILIITNKDDITTDFVVKKMNLLKLEYYRLNTEELLSAVDINFDFVNNNFELYDKNSNKTINLLKDISSIYFRRPHLPNLMQFCYKKKEKNFIEKELYYTLEGLYSILKNKFWISNPNDIRVAENKILQLQIAKEVGFNLPASLLSNSKKKEIAFLDKYNAIIKPIKSGVVYEDDKNISLIYTALINKKDLLENNSKFPAYLQEAIFPKTDIRVTVVGNKVFAAKIIYDNLNKIDWREIDSTNIKYEEHVLPENIISKCIQIVQKFNLIFGAIDLAIGKNGKYIFFEINPNGQWAWLEKNLGQNISEEIVNLLVNEGKYNE